MSNGYDEKMNIIIKAASRLKADGHPRKKVESVLNFYDHISLKQALDYVYGLTMVDMPYDVNERGDELI